MNGDTFCNGCGTRNPGDRTLCALCDEPLAGSRGERTAAHTPVPDGAEGDSSSRRVDPALYRTGEPCLLIVRGAMAGSRFMLWRDTTTVGRDPGSDIFLDDVTVSRRHAEIRRRGSYLLVFDTGSFNGTYLNGARIDDEALLAHGEELQVGKFRLSFLES